MRPETKAVMRVERIGGQKLACKHGYCSKTGWVRCGRKATHFIILGDDKLPACTKHKDQYLKRCAPLRQSEFPFPRSP